MNAILLDIQSELLQKFGSAGLVFLVMAIGIYYLYKEYKHEKKTKEDSQIKFNQFLQDEQASHIEMMTQFSNTLNNISQQVMEIKSKIK